MDFSKNKSNFLTFRFVFKTILFFGIAIPLNILFKQDLIVSAASVKVEGMKPGQTSNKSIKDVDGDTILSGNGCGPGFTQTTLNENITKYCTDLIGMRMENFPPKKEDMYKINYDDKCFSKCYLTEINYLNDGDNFDRPEIMNEIKKGTEQGKWPNVLSTTFKCVDSTESMAKDEGGPSNSICKYSLVFLVCMREEQKEMTC